jgi:hypothetical protein
VKDAVRQWLNGLAAEICDESKQKPVAWMSVASV